MSAPRRLLVVSPHFPPVNAPDHQRARHALPHLRALGWEPVILAVYPDEVAGAVLEPLLESTYSPDIEVHRTGALPLRWTRRIGMGTLGLRCLPQMARAGDALLAGRKFDAVFFTTTQFPVMALGPRWRRKFSVPYVLDFQDPWFADQPESSLAGGRPPGGSWKYRFSQWQARRLEPRTVRGAAGMVCVSPAYPPMLRRRYPEIPADRLAVLSFAASEADFAVARSLPRPAWLGRGPVWLYAGIARPEWRSVRAFLRAFAEARAGGVVSREARVIFVGTSYAPGGALPAVQEHAALLGLGESVAEFPARAGYFEVLRGMLEAEAVLMLGSDDAAYNASKVQTCVMARRPLLAIYHERSAAPAALAAMSAGTTVTFGDATTDGELAAKITRAWFLPKAAALATRTNGPFRGLGTAEMSRVLMDAIGRWTGAIPSSP